MVNAQQILAGYSMWLIVSGVIGNMVVISICYRLRKNTTFVFLGFIALSDMAASVNWNLNIFFTNFFSMSLQSTSMAACRIQNFIQYSSLQISAWLLVLLSIDRLLIVKVFKWKLIFKPKHTVLTCLACMTTFFSINSAVFVSYGTSSIVNGTEKVQCIPVNVANSSFIRTWTIVNSSLYSFVPFGALFLTNTLLILQFKQRKIQAHSTSSQKSQLMMNRSVIFFTIFFIVMTCPSAIITSILPSLVSTDLVSVIAYLALAFSLSYNAYELVILYFTNKRFAKELRSLFSNRSELASVSNVVTNK